MVTVVIGTMNEASNIEEILLVIQKLGYKCIVVDPGSLNGTVNIIKEKFPYVELIQLKENKGIAYSYLVGLEEACRNPFNTAIVQMDAGLTHDPWVIPKMIKELENAGLVIGSRFGRIKFLGPRTLLSWGASLLMKFIGVPQRDVTSGFRAWDPRVLRAVLESHHPISKGFAFQLEMLFWANHFEMAQTCSFAIKEIPIKYKLTNSSLNYKMILEALRTYWYLAKIYWSGKIWL